ncbi:patatin [Cloacibacterium rupense]|uniref:Patatin n=1 Tax=Cloacibacterium rupense TaxID=517423 RepID=A0ABQ2NHH0_9FLAO|nr:patatin-like phospholipase family protein [Cloacibacterium rupense]GGP03469.1 patatin [Cloacibacterium rupense]
MKKLIFLFCLLIFILNYTQVKENLVIPKNPKIGLSLAGGGAKGFAHVGVLKVLDSLGIKVDYISGTSMGAIVGGLYASGYTGKDIEKIVMDTDFYNLLSNANNRSESSFFNKSVDKYILKVPIKNGKVTLPSSISSGQKNIYMLKELFKNVSNIEDFNKLPIPFMCVATNLESGKMKIFEKGDLSESILASSAFPSLMDPVKIEDSIYIDGAMTVNYPSELLKKKGIDIVIGVDLNQGLNTRDKINSIVDILNQVIDFGIVKETKNQLKFTDVNIKPNLEGLGVTSFDEKDKILKSGYSEALKYVDILHQLPKKNYDYLRIPVNPIYSNIYKIDDIEVENNIIFNKDYIIGKMNLKLPSSQTYGSINKMLDKLYATNNYKIINYDIVQKENKNILKLNVNEDNNRFFLKFGLHYDEIFKSGLLVNTTIKRLLFRNSSLSIDGIIGDKPRYYLNYFIDNGYIPGIGINASGMSFQLKKQDKFAYESWKWYRTELFLQSVFKDKFAIGGGISYDIFNVTDLVSDSKKKGKFLNPYFFLKGDTQDSKMFPKRGYYTYIEAKAYNFLKKGLEESSLQIKADIRGNFPITKYLSYRLNTIYGISINKVDDFYLYNLGGIFEQNIVNFVRFNGYQFGEHKNNNIFKISNDFQFNFFKNYYLIGNLSLGNLFSDFEDSQFLKINYSSIGITAGYDSPFGQIKINYSYALPNSSGLFNVVLGHWF